MIFKRFIFLFLFVALIVLGIVIGFLYIITFPIIFCSEFIFFGTTNTPIFLEKMTDCFEWVLNTVAKKFEIDIEDDRVFLD